MSFNWRIYVSLNDDLQGKFKNPEQVVEHYKKHGLKEGRLWSLYQKYPDFDPEVYRLMYKDLLKFNKKQLEEHWMFIGRKEGRKYKEDVEIKEGLYDFIDAFLVINLEYRKDRWEEVMKELERIKVPKEKIVRIDAIYDKKGILRCTRSHIKCVDYAKEKDYGVVMIIEDDLNFIMNNEKINKGFELAKRALEDEMVGLCMVSGNKKKVERSDIEGLERAIEVRTSSAYLIKRDMYEVLRLNYRESERGLCGGGEVSRWGIDVNWDRIGGGSRRILTQCIGYQRPSYSDIERSWRDYGC